MDLLRLVLAKQPSRKVSQLTVLGRNRKFWQIAFPDAKIGSRDELLVHYTLRGDPYEESPQWEALENLRARAIFLRDVDMYEQFGVSTDGDVPTFWYALESGIVEIQAPALVALEDLLVISQEKAIDVLISYGDLTTIPWTPQLKGILIGYCNSTKFTLLYGSHGRDYMKMFFLCGYLGVEIKQSEVSNVHFFRYSAGCLVAITNGEEISEQDLRCEAIMETLIPIYDPYRMNEVCIISGYLYPIAVTTITFSSFAIAALQHARYSVLKQYLRRNPDIAFCSDLTILNRNLAARMAQILDDEKLMKMIPRNYANWYEGVTGRSATTSWSHIRRAHCSRAVQAAIDFPRDNPTLNYMRGQAKNLSSSD